MVTAVICGGSKGIPSSEFLEAVGVQLMRARNSHHRVEISLDLVQGVLNEVLRRRRTEKADDAEVERIASSMVEEAAEDEPCLPVSESRKVPEFHFDGLEITDLEQLDTGSSYDSLEEIEEVEEEEEEEEEIEVVSAPAKRRATAMRSQRKNYWISSVNVSRVLVISLLGFLLLAGLVLLGG